ncbi:MAG: DMT family transporter [Proteobacteria bacterium]|nr:DMT family transporter [Pseudomonadota bacterium]
MLAVSLGVFAALCWSIHDLLAKIYAETAGPYRMAFWVMVAGAIALLPVILWRGHIWEISGPGLILPLIMGCFYAFAVAGLFKAFSLAPVSIVGPFTAGYPALVIFWRIYMGLVPSAVEWLALALAASGALIVARTGPKDGGLAMIAPGQLGPVIVASVVASICFATTIVLGQTAAPLIGEYEATFISRFPAALILAPLAWRDGTARGRIGGRAWLGIAGMALLDVAAVSGVNAAGMLPGSDYSAMGISLYGAIAVLLAMIFLKEKVTAGQWLGIGAVVAGVLLLAWPQNIP